MANKDSTRQRYPWYLRKSWVYILCLVLPPIGIINVFVHQNYWQHDEQMEYAGIVIITGSFWMLKFFPFWMTIVFAVLAFLCLYALDLIDLIRK